MTVLHIGRSSLPTSMEPPTDLRPLQGGSSRKVFLPRERLEENTRDGPRAIGSVGAQSAASNERAIFFSKKVLRESSAEHNIWSIYHPIWNKNRVKRPRMPKPYDPSTDWAEFTGRPDGLSHFLGLKNGSNRMTLDTLTQLVKGEQFVEDIILYGAKGVGKSALIKIFLKEYFGRFAPSVEEVDTLYSTRVLHIAPEELSMTPKQLKLRARKYLSRKPDRIPEGVPRFVVVDRMEAVPAKAQQTLCALMDHAKAKLDIPARRQDDDDEKNTCASGVDFGAVAGGVRMLMATRDISRLVASLRGRIKPLKLERVEEADGVRILVRILRLESVGYEPLAVRAIFRKHWPDLRRCIDTAKQVFCEKQFLSEINTLKVISPRALTQRDSSVHHVKASAALGPLGRCGICTLPPPCTHLPEEKLASIGIARRAELPQRRANRAATKGTLGNKTRLTSGIDCQDFVRHGSCRAFNSRGRCGLHHPLDAHIVDMPKPRCPQCTIHLPCRHCDYDVARQRLRDTCKALEIGLQSMISQRRQLVSDSPPEKQSVGGDHGQASAEAETEILVGASPGSNEIEEKLASADGGVTEDYTGPLPAAALASDPAAHVLTFISTGVALSTMMMAPGVTRKEASTKRVVTATATARPGAGDHHHDVDRAPNVDELTISGETGVPPHEAGRDRGRGAEVLRKLHGLSVFRGGNLDVASTTPAPPTAFSDKISDLEKLREDAATTAAWTIEASPGGGLTEFRALEFERRTRDFLQRFEEACRQG